MEKSLSEPWRPVIGAAAGLTLVVAVILLAFVWTPHTATLKRFPIALVGLETGSSPPPMVAYADQDQFRLTVAPNPAEAERQVKAGEVFGALVLGPHPEVLKGTSWGSAPAAVMGRLQDSLPEGRGTDVAPPAGNELGLEILFLPFLLAGCLGGVASSLLGSGPGRRLAFLGMFCPLAAAVAVAVLHGWLGVLPGPVALLLPVLASTFFAVGSLVAGLYGLIGVPGLGLGIVFTILVSYPLSGATLPAVMILEPWGPLGQGLAPGAAVSLLRRVTHFLGADLPASWTILAAWSALGTLLIGAASRGTPGSAASEGGPGRPSWRRRSVPGAPRSGS